MNTQEAHTTVVLCPHADVRVRLRGSVEGTLLLAIGSTAEITLHEAQVRALHADIATALHDVELIAAAGRIAGKSFDAGAQARRAAALAGERADAADRLGHADLARRLRREAGAAIEAAEEAQEAAEAVARTIDAAESATDRLDRVLREGTDLHEHSSRSAG
ncbi:hypothetical protein [Actinosynnema sp. NPDC023587]|uniref:hypothetical protein n=1 Tax=Actinosynnema sp. NPDC023587 TaxID=3154695 RepID=UPI0033CD26F0